MHGTCTKNHQVWVYLNGLYYSYHSYPVCFMATSVPQACSIEVVNDELENVLDGSGRGLN